MIHYQVKAIPRDFQVFEVMNLIWSPANTGNYHYYYMNKAGHTTFEAVKTIADYTGLPEMQICYSGLKDEDGITSQYISIPQYFDNDFFHEFHRNETQSDDKFIKIRYFGTGDKPLKIANLIGNCFHLTIRNLSEATIAKISKLKNYTLFFINYYGSQRFGLPNQIKNTHLIGKAIIENNYKNAIGELKLQDSRIGLKAKNYKGDEQEFFHTIDKRMQAFFQSAYYSYLWNQEVTGYLNEMACEKSHLCMDNIDFNFLANDHDVLKLLQTYPQTCNTRVTIENDEFKNIIHDRSTVVQTKITVEKIHEDTLNDGKYSCDFSFFLPSGCYATIALNQFMEKFATQ